MVLRQNQRRNRTIHRWDDTSSKCSSTAATTNTESAQHSATHQVSASPVRIQSVWVPPQNWPVMLVKGEIDPAIITGTLRYAGYNQSLYQLPIAEAGKVWAHMTMRSDPYTGQNRPDLPTIDAQAYVNATAHGHYEVEGLAPGVYDFTLPRPVIRNCSARAA